MPHPLPTPENYRLQSKYENHLIAKVALFQFVNSFLSLFYIAFYLRDQDKLKEASYLFIYHRPVAFSHGTRTVIVRLVTITIGPFIHVHVLAPSCRTCHFNAMTFPVPAIGGSVDITTNNW